MVNMRQALGVDDFNQMSNYTGQLQNQRRSVGQKQYGLGGKVLNMAAALGDAYNQYQPPETALGMMALPAKAVYGLGNMIVQDVGDKTKSIMGTDRSNPAAMDQAATDALGLAADTMAGGGVVSRMTDMPQGAILGANVFQGGPHKYGPEGASESLKHMSKGEGAQAYGYGRYDAGAEQVGKEYQQAAADSTGYKLLDSKGQEVNHPHADWVARISSKNGPLQDQAILQSKNMDDIDTYNSMLEAISILNNGGSVVPKSAYIYKHDLPDEDIARYLDYDAPLSEQPESVRKALGYGSGNIKKTEVDEVITFSDGVNSVTVPKKPSGTNLNYFSMKGSGPLSNMQPLTRSANSHEQAEKVARQWLEGTTTTGDQLLHKTGKNQASSEALAKAGIPGLKYYDGMSRNKPTKDIKKSFQDELPDDAGFDEIDDLLGTGHFSPDSEEILQALKGDDWFGFDYPSQAISAALGKNINNWEPSARLTQAIAKAKDGGTRNFVTWDQDVLNRMKLLERNGESMVDALSGVNNK